MRHIPDRVVAMGIPSIVMDGHNIIYADGDSKIERIYYELSKMINFTATRYRSNSCCMCPNSAEYFEGRCDRYARNGLIRYDNGGVLSSCNNCHMRFDRIREYTNMTIAPFPGLFTLGLQYMSDIKCVGVVDRCKRAIGTLATLYSLPILTEIRNLIIAQFIEVICRESTNAS